ncbi:Transmembrane protein 237 [Labeo rohita]|uniref:Transmembrane protein 237 n=1 Tax=Labeo rohita TaxID=84645 RepID=A0ABQ8MSH5_LABRO|nr:Transmembrane protein 237 [Labeo rohita]
MFHIVSFVETNEVEVVPSSWVHDEQCVWPNLQGESLTKAVKLAMNPRKDWKKFRVKLLYTTDIQSDAEGGVKKPRRIMKSLRLRNFEVLNDRDDDDYGQNSRALKPPPHVQPPTFQSVSPLCQPASQLPASQPVSDETSLNILAGQPPLIHQLSLTHQPSLYQPASQPPVIQQSSLFQSAIQPSSDNSPTMCMSQSHSKEPADSESISYLGLVGGFDLKDIVWRVLKVTFTAAVARGMNWRGVNGKICVQRLVLKEVIIGKNLSFEVIYFQRGFFQNNSYTFTVFLSRFDTSPN